MNKQDLQQNNTGLQAILAAVNSLPTAKSWGGAPIIEPSSEDIVIPAFTNVDLTVKGVNLSDYGIDFGQVRLNESKSKVTINHSLNAVPSRFYFTAVSPLINGEISELINVSGNSCFGLYINAFGERAERKGAYITKNSSTVEMIHTSILFANGTYNWIAMK